MKLNFLCPICRSPLIKENRSLKCRNSHCFDISKYGYVNLLIKGGKKGHGDDKVMVNARRSFLSKGYYGHLKTALCREIIKYIKPNTAILDSGCGEGYYTSEIYNAASHIQGVSLYGIDVSKEALKIASKSCLNAGFAAASAYCLPFEDKSIDILTCVFSPLALEEFQRVLKNDGIFITVIPLENHLFSLKKAVYDTPYKNNPASTEIKGFELVSSQIISKNITLKSNEDLKNLFMMTPYYYKTSIKDQEKLNSLDTLTVETEFMILTYKQKET